MCSTQSDLSEGDLSAPTLRSRCIAVVIAVLGVLAPINIPSSSISFTGSIPPERLYTVALAQTGELIIDNAAAGVQDAGGGRTSTGRGCTPGATNFSGTDSLFSCGGGAGADTYR